MTKKLIDIEEIQKKCDFHRGQLQKWETVLKALSELEAEPKSNSDAKNTFTCDPGKSATAKVTEIAVKMLKSGMKINNSKTFLKEISRQKIVTKSGREFTSSTLSSVLGQSGKVIYNRGTGYWELI